MDYLSEIKLPISAMVVGFNEERLLPICLQSISFCDDIHYTDLGSKDNSVKVAERFTNNIYLSEPVPSCEMIQTNVVHKTKHDWVIFIDPDEELDISLRNHIIMNFKELTSQPLVGGIIVPWQFYFKKKRLLGTAWGGRNEKFFLVNKNRFSFEPIVHYGRKLNQGYKSFSIELNHNESNVLHHYWMNDWNVFFQKHRRYLINEGKDRYLLGKRTSLRIVLISPLKEFYISFWKLNGFKDGFLGFLLSLFWAFYQTTSQIRLYQYQIKMYLTKLDYIKAE